MEVFLFRSFSDLDLFDDGRRLDGLVDEGGEVAGTFPAAFDFELLLGLEILNILIIFKILLFYVLPGANVIQLFTAVSYKFS